MQNNRPRKTAGIKKGSAKSTQKKSPKAPAPKKKKKKTVVSNSKLVTVVIKDHKDVKGGHPHIIMDDVDDKHVSVGLSTKPKKGKNSPNYKLEVSPLGDGKTSYARRQGTVDKKQNYNRKREGKMTKVDHDRVKEYGKRAKEKYLEKSTKKSSEPPNTP